MRYLCNLITALPGVLDITGSVIGATASTTEDAGQPSSPTRPAAFDWTKTVSFAPYQEGPIVYSDVYAAAKRTSESIADSATAYIEACFLHIDESRPITSAALKKLDDFLTTQGVLETYFYKAGEDSADYVYCTFAYLTVVNMRTSVMQIPFQTLLNLSGTAVVPSKDKADELWQAYRDSKPHTLDRWMHTDSQFEPLVLHHADRPLMVAAESLHGVMFMLGLNGKMSPSREENLINGLEALVTLDEVMDDLNMDRAVTVKAIADCKKFVVDLRKELVSRHKWNDFNLELALPEMDLGVDSPHRRHVTGCVRRFLRAQGEDDSLYS